MFADARISPTLARMTNWRSLESDRGLDFTKSYETTDPVTIYGRLERAQHEAVVPPGTVFGFEFYASRLPLDLEVSATRAPRRGGALARVPIGVLDPSHRDDRFQIDPFGHPIVQDPTPLPPPPGGAGSLQAAVVVQLFRPGSSVAIAEWTHPEEMVEWNARRHSFPEGRPSPDLIAHAVGWWRITVTPVGPYPVDLRVSARCAIGAAPLRTTSLSTRLQPFQGHQPCRSI
jgi:hypothetical protein